MHTPSPEIPFVGRSTERALFEARLDDATRADGSLTLLYGESGLGKTALARNWLETARQRSFTVASVANFAFANDPYGPIAEACRIFARAEPRALPRGENRTTFSRFLELAPTGAGERWHKRRLFVIVREFLERLASLSPFALAFDDAQWLDPESLELLQYLAPHLADSRAAALLTVRTDLPEHDGMLRGLDVLERGPSAYRVVLGPLSPDETRQLIFAALPPGRRLHRRTIDEICRRSEGHPLFAGDLARQALTDTRSARLPASIAQSVEDRLKALEPGEVEVLEAAAVIGGRLDPALVSALFPAAGEGWSRTLRTARDLGLLVDDDEGGLRFRHERVREAVETRLTSSERRALHDRIADALLARPQPGASAQLQRHLTGAGRHEEAGAIAERAGDGAMAHAAFAMARDHYEAALAGRRVDDESAARVAEKLGQAYDLLGSHAESSACYARAFAHVQTTGNAEHAARIAIRRAILAGRLSDAAAEREHCAQALALCGGMGPHAFAAEVLLALHDANHVDPAGAEAHLMRADAIAERDAAFVVRHHVACAAIAHLRGDDAAWRAASLAAADAAEAHDDPAMLANVWSSIADFARLKGDGALAARGFARAIEVADRYALTFSAAKSRLAAADNAFVHGRVGDALALVREAAALQVDGTYAHLHVAAVGIPIALAADDLLLAERLEDRALLASLATGELPPLAVSFVAAHVELHAAREERDAVRSLIAAALPRLRQAAFIDSALLIFAQCGDAATARAAARLLETTADRDDPVASAHTPLVAAIAAVRAGDAARATALARQAQRLAERAGARLLEALALELAGDPDAARELYAACGAHRDVQRLEPARPRRVRRAVELTRREAEVAQCVAEGLSNRAIAERLTLSDRTVEHHVAAIFGKLGFRSRAQLAAVMSRSSR